jgi:tetratricopeptide (TPR) repeat protein
MENVIWSKQYDRKMSDLIALQNEIARDVSANIQARRPGNREEAKASTSDPEAYQLYLRGRFFWNRRTPKDLQRSIEYFQQAIDRDPNYAGAYAGLANAYPYLASYGNMPAREVMPKARDAALKAISLDGDLAEAHSALGLILHGFDHDYPAAEREHLLSIELNPNYATAYQLYGEMLDCRGRHDEAEAQFRKALDIDPLSLIINRVYGEHLLFSRKYDEAVTQLTRTVELDPNFYTAHAMLAYAYQSKRQNAESAEEYAKTHDALGEVENARAMRESYKNSGWQGFLRFMTGEKRPPTMPMFNVAQFSAELGEKEKALSILESLSEDRNYLVNWLNVDPRFDILRDEAQFRELVKKLNLVD